MNDTEKLIQKMNVLMESLEASGNEAIEFFRDVLDLIQKCNTEEELKKILDGYLIHASRITDYGGFNREQCNLFSEMWQVADAICTNSEE